MRLEIHDCCAPPPRSPESLFYPTRVHTRTNEFLQSSTEGVSQEKLKEAQLTSMQMQANHPMHLCDPHHTVLSGVDETVQFLCADSH